MICESHVLSRGFLFSLVSPQIERRFSRLFPTQMEHFASLQQHVHLPGNSNINSSSSLLLSKMKNEARSLVYACQKLRANPSPAFHQKPLKNVPRSSCLFSPTQKMAAKVFPRALMSHGTPLLHSSTIVENPFSEQTKKEWSGVVVGPEKRTKQPLLTVAVDIDEVLGSFLLALNTFIAEQYFREHNISEFHVYDFTKVWQCSRAEADLRVHSFFKSKHFDKGILPIPGAYKSLLQIATFCDLCVVTSRQNAIKEETNAWIERHYSGIFREVHFGNHFALEGEARTKSDICRGLVSYCVNVVCNCCFNIKLFGMYVTIEILVVIDNLSFAWGLSFLAASTSALFLSSQIAFNALFSYLLVGQKMTGGHNCEVDECAHCDTKCA